jgi:hypothetical protein
MVLDAGALDAINGDATPISHYYFAGTNADGIPIWDLDPNNAVPLIHDDEIPSVNQMSVTYDSNLGIWLLLYGGRSPFGFAL